MKHLKKFESFNSEKLNENWFSKQFDKIKGFVKNFKSEDLFKKDKIKKALESKTLTSKEKEIIAQEIADFCTKAKLTPEQLQDSELVAAKLQELSNANSNPNLDYIGEHVNEGMTEWWTQFKSKNAGFFKKIGIGLVLTGIISLGVDATMANLSNLDAAGDAMRTIGPLAMFAGSAIAIGLISLNIGLNNINAKIKK